MAPGVPDIEGNADGHNSIPVKSAVKYLQTRGYSDLISIYDDIKPVPNPYLYIGSTKQLGANRVVFGEAVNTVLDKLSKEEAAKKVMVIDSTFGALLIGCVCSNC
jgi:hypothetical protein